MRQLIVMTGLGTALITAAALAPAGCGKNDARSTTAPSAPAPAATTPAPTPTSPAPASAALAVDAGAKAKPVKVAEGPKCPTELSGVTTKAKDVKNGVELTLTTKDTAIEHQLQDLAKEQAALKTDQTTEPACPIVHKDTSIAVVNIAGGARITVTTAQKKEVAELRKTTHQRLKAEAPPANKGIAAPATPKAAAKKKSS